MALATRCPHCQTTFRVAHDQLKLRAGLVRCGACKEIFNGVEHLLSPEEVQQLPARPAPPPPSSVSDAASAQAKAIPPLAQAPFGAASPPLPAETAGTDGSGLDQASSAAASGLSSAPAQEADNAPEDKIHLTPDQADFEEPTTTDPLQRMTLMDFTAFETQSRNTSDEVNQQSEPTYSHSEVENTTDGNPNSHDELSQAIEDLQNKPWRDEKSKKLRNSTIDGADNNRKAEPGFMARARRQKRYGKATRLTMIIGSAVLLLALLLQGVFAFRNTIAAHLPEYRPVLTEFCTLLACQIQLPARVEMVSIESSELQSLPSAPNKFTLAALLRNQAASDQAWPFLELTLNDMNEKPVARKIFQPGDYLASPGRMAGGFPAESEQQIKVSFELLDLKAAGYRLYLFYP